MGVSLSKNDILTMGLVVGGLALQSALVWTAATIYHQTPPQLAVFDADKSVERFVVWSSDRVDDDSFDEVLGQFGLDVERQLDLWSASSGIAVVRQGSVIARGDTTLIDWTDGVVAEVLQ